MIMTSLNYTADWRQDIKNYRGKNIVNPHVFNAIAGTYLINYNQEDWKSDYNWLAHGHKVS